MGPLGTHLVEHADAAQLVSGFEATINKFDKNFSAHLLDLLARLSIYSTSDCEHGMASVISRWAATARLSPAQRSSAQLSAAQRSACPTPPPPTCPIQLLPRPEPAPAQHLPRPEPAPTQNLPPPSTCPAQSLPPPRACPHPAPAPQPSVCLSPSAWPSPASSLRRLDVLASSPPHPPLAHLVLRRWGRSVSQCCSRATP
ncbi:hypothetical protein P7K49_024805 [Saguinus oedipus]|uniref:Uncharacterized protein n=1 Tax=Saguinus oedipus TaxID=9490 RepID=A0ABQ9URC9_SAGOE|nr:hypothetical protein P7K49_024805 [Saguinus oedipus]